MAVRSKTATADPDTALTFDACLESPDGAVGG